MVLVWDEAMAASENATAKGTQRMYVRTDARTQARWLEPIGTWRNIRVRTYARKFAYVSITKSSKQRRGYHKTWVAVGLGLD